MQSKTKVTVFQALTLLAEHYKSDSEKYKQIMNLYLTGIRRGNEEDKNNMEALLSDPILSDYMISRSAEDISSDPVRRYFESTLCARTMASSIDNLDSKIIYKNFCGIFDTLPITLKVGIPLMFYKGFFPTVATKLSATAAEYIDMFGELKKENRFAFLKTEEANAQKDKKVFSDRKNKLMIIGQSVHAAMSSVSSNSNQFPLDLYNRAGSQYDSTNRGRTNKEEQGEVKSNNLGIMSSEMPLAKTDMLLSESSSNYVRPVENSSYNENASEPKSAFSTLVTPFVNSISGTMLCQIRVMARLCKENQFAFKGNQDQLALYFKNLVALMIFSSGGHSLDEFLRVLQIPEVQKEFEGIIEFEKLTLDNLFRVGNQNAFDEAVKKTIEYNAMMIKRQKVRDDLKISSKSIKEKISENGGVVTNDALTLEVRKGLRSAKLPRKRSLDEKNELIDRLYKEIFEGQYTENWIEKRNELAKLLNIDVSGKTDAEINSVIMKIMGERQEALKSSLYDDWQGTLSERLDKAYQIYIDENRTLEDRKIVQDFLIYVLDIQNPKDINKEIASLMAQRELIKKHNPDFIPKISFSKIGEDNQLNTEIPKDDLLEVNRISQAKDKGELTGKKTTFFNPNERSIFQVIISGGKFTKGGKTFDSTNYISHNKKGFVVFTFNVNGEISVFNHIDHDVTGVAHFKDLSSQVSINSNKSKEYSQFYEMDANDSVNIWKGATKQTLLNANQDFKKYNSFNIISFIYLLKDYFIGSNLTKEKQDIANQLSSAIHSKYEEINKITSKEEMFEAVNQIIETIKGFENNDLAESGRLKKLIENTISELTFVKEKVFEEKEMSKILKQNWRDGVKERKGDESYKSR